MQQIEIKQPKEILESLLRREPFNLYIIDERKGIVYERNEGFEAGMGNLYEVLGRLDLKVITAHKKEMNSNYVKFIDESNREEMLRAINTGWTSWWSVCTNSMKYL